MTFMEYALGLLNDFNTHFQSKAPIFISHFISHSIGGNYVEKLYERSRSKELYRHHEN